MNAHQCERAGTRPATSAMRAIERGTRICELAPEPRLLPGIGVGAMDQHEYRERLQRFENHVSAARVHSGILETMMVDDPDSRSVLDTYPGFFVYAKAALHNGMLLETAKALDKDARTASLPNLVKAARESPEFAPGVDIPSIERWLRERSAFVRALIRLRNTRLAHFDVPVTEPLEELEYGEFTDVLAVLWMCSVKLYCAFHQVAAVSDDRVREARAHTGEIHRILVAHRRHGLMSATS
ncbi:MAG: hypothetical protein F4Z08_11385 [Chloroflexi bacterium]|nr:hypothetical protein [Chloroflexota bacterium]